jgi:phosphoserine phosphatase RsbU/P
VNFSIQPVWKRAGKVTKTFAGALPLYLILRFLRPDSGIETFVAFVTYVLAGWIALRLLRIGLRKVTWRLRNRLVVAYLFIAVLPIVLVLTLVGLGAYMLAGQVAAYLVRSELDRRVTELRSVARDLSSSPAAIERIGRSEQERFPGLLLWSSENGSIETWPAEAPISLPSGLPANSSGVTERQGRYYAWADALAGGEQALVLTPLTRRFMSGLAPGLGDFYFLQVATPQDTRQRSPVDNDFTLQPAGTDAAPAALPPAVNEFDLEVRWGSLLQANGWEHPSETETALLTVHTRLSAILAVILSQGSDALQGGVVVVFYALAIAFLVVGVAGLALGISISRNITGAVQSLYEGTQRVMQGDFSHLIQVKGRDQLAELSNSFNTMTQNLEHLLAVSKEKERLETEIEIARGVQDQLYPKEAPVIENLQVLGKCDPARMVSGDYYDYQLVDGKLAIAIGDVAGKGISAALLMATIQAAVRMELRASVENAAPALNDTRYSTARMVSELNLQLHATTSPEKYATFFFGIYDQATGVLTYTNAGHLQPLLFRRGAAIQLDVSGLMVGAFPFAKYEESRIELCSGDLLVCYTDGITEPENEYGEMFGEQRLIDVVAKNADREEAQIIESVMECVREWTGAPELSDDMTVLLARRR